MRALLAEADATARSVATQKLVPRALWWFRWSALVTFLSGALIIANRATANAPGVPLMVPWSAAIFTGALFGTVMLANVWGVIWRNQKVVIASAVAAASGGQANPAAAAAGRRAFLASPTNVVFSIPMLFFMGAATPWPPTQITHLTAYWVAVLILRALVELNALTAPSGITTKPIEKVSGVIITGFVFWAVMYALVKFVLSA